MIRSHKIALDPTTPKQARRLAQHAGYARVAYNHALADFKDGLGKGEWRTHYELRPRWNQVKAGRYPWCKELSQNAAKYAIIQLGDAVRAWRSDRQKNRFPRFKSRRGKAAFRADNGPGTVRSRGRRIHLPRIGSLRMREALRFDGGVLECTVKRDAGRWFACVCVEDGREAPKAKNGRVIGVDMGVKTLATCSDGTVYANPRAEAAQRRKIRRYNKALSRSLRLHGRHKASKRRQRTRHKLAGAHYKAACLRSDAQHKASTEIVRRAACVVRRRPERERHGEEPSAGACRVGCRHERLRQQARVQVRRARRPPGSGRPLVCVHEAVLPLRPGTGDAVERSHVFVRLRYGAGPGPERGKEPGAIRRRQLVGGAKRTWRPCKTAFGRQRPAKRQRKHWTQHIKTDC